MAADETYTPNPNAPVPNPKLINKTRQDIGAGLLEASFGILGETFAQDSGNPNAAIPYQKLGATISGALHDRWHKQEYENFQAQYVQNYQRAATAIHSNLQTQMAALSRGELLQPDGSITKIDVDSEGFLRTQDTVIRQSVQSVHKINDQFLQDAAKYATNPYISNIAQSLMQSNSQQIAEATGPTPAAEAEAGYAKMENVRQDTITSRQLGNYYDRMPAGRGGSDDEDLENMDPKDIVRKYGPDGAIRIFSGTPVGRKLTSPWQTTAVGQIKKQLIAENPELADDEDALGRAMEENEELVQHRTIGLYMKSLMPEVAEELEGLEEFERYFPTPKEEEEEGPQITGILDRAQTEEAVGQINAIGLQELERVVRNGQASNIDAAINIVMNKWLPKYLRDNVANNKNTLEFKKEAARRLKEYLSTSETWRSIPILRERFGGGRGTLEKIDAKVNEARKKIGIYETPEARSEQPDRGLFKK